MTKAEILAAFDALPPYRRFQALRIAAGEALRVWRAYRLDGVPLEYSDGIVGGHHTVDDTLPARAIEDIDAMLGGRFPDPAIAHGYLEPITAMQDGDLDVPGTVELAYYAIRNLHRLIAKQVTPTAHDRQPTSHDEHVVFSQICNAIAATEAWVDEWWTRVWDAWASTPDLAYTPRLSEAAFDALASGDLATALVETDGAVRAIVLALSGQLPDAVTAAAAALGATLTPELRRWLEAHLFALCPEAIAVEPSRRYVVIRSTQCAGWNLVTNQPEPVKYLKDGSLYRLVRFQHHGSIFWTAGERVDAQGAWATFIEGRIDDPDQERIWSEVEIMGVRSLAAVGGGVIAHHASRVLWSGPETRETFGEVAVHGAAVDDDGSVVATHDGVRVSIWYRETTIRHEPASCARIVGPAAPRLVAIGGQDLLVVWADGTSTTRLLE